MDRRTTILQTAAKLFREKGFHGVGMDEIGKGVGVSGPAIYHHFAGKDEILATLFDEAMDRVAIPSHDGFATPEEELDFLVRHHARFVVANRDFVAIYAHEYRALVDPWRRSFAKRTREHATRWESAIAAVHPGADAVAVTIAAQAAIGLLHSVVFWPPALLDESDLVERLRDQVVGGLDVHG
jgi:AcrR family transcriptional regulator